MKLSSDGKTLLGLFLPFYLINCVQQGYFLYGNVLRSYGYSQQTIGQLLGCFYIAVMLMRPVGGWALERFGARRVLVTSAAATLAGSVVLFFARSISMVVLGRLLLGAGFSLFSLGIFAYQALSTPAEKRGGSISIVVAGGILPLATIIPFGEWLLTHGWRNAYLAMGPLLAVFCIYLGSRVGVETAGAETEEQEEWGSYRDLIASKSFLLLIITGALISLIDATIVSISLFASEVGVLVSFFMASNAIAAVIVRVPCARILNAIPRKKALIPCGLLLPFALLYMAASPSNFSFLLGGVVSGIGIGAAWPMILALASDILPQRLRPKGTAITVLSYDSCWLITPLIVGYFSGVLGMAKTYAILSLFSIAALSALYFFFWVPGFKQGKKI